MSPPSESGFGGGEPSPCHDPLASRDQTTNDEAPKLPPYAPGDRLSELEQQILSQIAQLLFELEPDIAIESVKADRSLWELGYDSLALVALRVGIRRLYGPGLQPMVWLQLHSENPLIGCFVRYLAANGARPGEVTRNSFI